MTASATLSGPDRAALRSAEKQCLARADHGREDLYGMLSSLVRIDSQNFRTDGREAPCADWMMRRYEALGLETERYCPDALPGFTRHPDYLPGRNTAERPNVSGLWPGADRTDEAGAVMLAAHTDTMPVGDPAQWSVDPFGGLVRDGRLYGLGAGDNKSGLSAALFAVKTLRDLGLRLRRPVVLAAYCDEEYGGGNGALAACLKHPCETYVNLDGGNYALWTIALGGGGYRIDLHKTSSTDSLMDLHEAVAGLMDELKGFAARRREELHRIPLYAGSDMERSAFRLTHFACREPGFNDASVRFVLYTDKSRTAIEAELREMLDRLEPLFKRYDVVTEGFNPNTRFFHYCQTDKGNGAADAMRRAAEETAGRPVVEEGSCLTDLSLFLKYGSPHSFNFGILRDFALPGGSHQPDEYVDCDQLLAYAKALMLFLLRFCGLAED